ncbi:MAG: pyridoxal 5'-phosphate synthase glutaminase subunit PdxT [Clostridiales bacterium]|nr:pyridoxal 5'-phosphate synthase glutaminase subunit PdxT [Clostridiales bacterium]
MKVGVLGFQGSIEEHVCSLSKIEGVNPLVVKTKKDLEEVRGIILPGGESTTIGKLLHDFDMMGVLKERIQKGMPVWGTCAGMILMAKRIVNQDKTYLGVMNITVKRNAYGGQLDSFKRMGSIPCVSSHEIPLVFIRAPWIENVASDVYVLSEVDGNIVAAKSKNMLVTSFHPELTSDLSFHKYFVNMCKNY